MKNIFIGGCGRSGTTLVQKMIIIHLKASGGDEFDHLHHLSPIYNIMNYNY